MMIQYVSIGRPVIDPETGEETSHEDAGVLAVVDNVVEAQSVRAVRFGEEWYLPASPGAVNDLERELQTRVATS